MKLISWNIEGLKAKVEGKRLQDLVAAQKPDLLCLQEVKTADFPHELNALGFKNILHNTQKQNSGVMTLCNRAVVADKKCEFADDAQARAIESHFGDFVLFNIYFPLGDKDMDYKLKFYSDFIDYLANFSDKKVIICGDFNIAHKDMDLNTQWSGVGTLADERALMDKLINLGFVDTLRAMNASERKITWISHQNRNAKNYAGLRLDYIFISENLRPALKNAFIVDSSFGSDHNPIGVEIEL
ncbi:exodeoxyribonuclease III [Helicobacter sp. 23-1044]